ncbi:uncharacterized protein BP5553_01813 [Venustampulla echinocandica]|uniref:Uncharacterized protein n=1 Tax=Venustampulla echinocandica TaxID=2656787 RepID=A0A370U228_9HELO|nr:uncharacterized protein BP5553_01813 [Venustampulla echinocandica]RDL41834.1 hypothetical protein BP5553_01813 [Venustampulla echinocandica]
MAAKFDTATPPPPTLHTPTTPRFGTFDDDYQPYSPRKSSRVAQRSRSAQTPPRQVSSHNLRASHSTPQSSNRSSSSTMADSLPTSPQTASKKRVPQSSLQVGGRRVSGALDYEATTSAAMALGLPTPHRTDKMDARRSITVDSNGMLPTPAKTPKKAPGETDPAVKAVARNLFSVHSATMDEVMPSPKKKGRKKFSGYTMNSFAAEDENEPISIFTDSQDRVPEVDVGPDNPFYGESSKVSPEPAKRASKRRKVVVPGEGEQDFEEVERREDGLIYVFRGKKVFRKFSEVVGNTGSFTAMDADEEDVDTEMGGDYDAPASNQFSGRITRSSVKPRLLFPSAQQLQSKELKAKAAAEEEEADTDIEEPSSITRSPYTRGSRNVTTTPMDQMEDEVATPKAPRFAPVSPPTTTRTTRSKNFDMMSSPATPSSGDECPSTRMRGSRSRGGKVSPFDSWQRVKADEPKGANKREGEPLARGRGGKRIRN